MDRYDAGLLSGNDEWSTEQWHDLIRHELDCAHDHYDAQFNDLLEEKSDTAKRVHEKVQAASDAIDIYLVEIEQQLDG